MQKFLFAMAYSVLYVLFVSNLSVRANDLSEILCNSYDKIQKISETGFSEKLLLLEDYLIYLRGGDTFFPWNNIPVDKETVLSMSFKQVEKYLSSEKDKQVLKKLMDNFPNFVKETDVKIVFMGGYLLYVEEKCSSDIIEKVYPLKQKVIEEEKILFSKRTNGRKLHSEQLEYFTLTNQSIQPSKDFIYEYEEKNNPRITDIRLRVLQVVPSGVLVKADSYSNEYLRLRGTSADKIIFVETKQSYVDEDLLRKGFYEYVGTKSYNSFLGNRTIHSFREITNPFENISFYNGRD